MHSQGLPQFLEARAETPQRRADPDSDAQLVPSLLEKISRPKKTSRPTLPQVDQTRLHLMKPQASTHLVEHDQILNKPQVWVLMAAVMMVIGVLCIKMETDSRNASTSKDDEPNLTQQTWVRFAFCVIALNVSMLLWGLSQEYMMTNFYGKDRFSPGERPSALCLVLFNRFCSVCFCGFILWLQGSSVVFPGKIESGFPAATNLVASWCQYESLAYVSFPLLTATKSAKLMPVLVMSSFRGKKHSLMEYAEAILMISALAVFGLETQGDDDGSTSTWLGLVLLAGLIFFDSITPHLQDSLFKRHETLTVLQGTFAMSFFACLICFCTLCVTGELLNCLAFFSRHHDAVLQAIVLSLCSTLTQFLISYTVKNFGPVVFAAIATSRQVLSVCLSNVLFNHHMSGLAWTSGSIVFGTLLLRPLRSRASPGHHNASETTALIPSSSVTTRNVVDLLRGRSREYALLVCSVGICVPLGFYSVAQEFMVTHTFKGDLFKFPLFLIAMNRTCAAVLSLVVLKFQGISVCDRRMLWTRYPAGANLLATLCQYQALYFIRFPVQSLLKSIKIIPVMICGKLFKNREYGWVDYAEAAFITVLVALFTYNFEGMHHLGWSKNGQHISVMTLGVILMAGYIVTDSFTSNAEDYIYQTQRLDPGQMLLGMQATSGIIAWTILLFSGQLNSAVDFIYWHPFVLLHIGVLMLAEACGAYACTITVRIFGPATFTLLLMAHQLQSLLVSVILFNHEVNRLNCVCLAMVSVMVLTSSVRRAAVDDQPRKDLSIQPFGWQAKVA